MSNEEHWALLQRGVAAWNEWRAKNPEIWPDLSGLNLENLFKEEVASGIDDELQRSMFLSSKGYGADLSEIDLSRTNLWGTRLQFVKFTDADLTEADLTRANLRYADLSGANLTNASLYEADLYFTNLSRANLINTNLLRARLVDTNIEEAVLENCNIHGISVWELKSNDRTQQRNLVISDPNDPSASVITVDDIEVAQFVYLLLHNEKLRKVIDTIGKKAILILGRFTPHRHAVLVAIKEALRGRGYIPIVFNFAKPESRDLTETISILAHMSRFIVADITDAKSISQELQIIVPNLPSVPVKPILAASQREYALFEHFKRYPWVLPVHYYENHDTLIANIDQNIVVPAENKAKEVRN